MRARAGSRPRALAPLFRLLDPLLGVTATVELAGDVTGFDANGALAPGKPIVTLPVKIRLRNPLLGGNCTIGSDANPILLRPQTITQGTISGSAVSGVLVLEISGATLGDDSFAVPRAEGCGPLGLLDRIVDQQVGLPSPEGRNRIVLEDATMATALSQQGGAKLAEAWHAHVIEE